MRTLTTLVLLSTLSGVLLAGETASTKRATDKVSLQLPENAFVGDMVTGKFAVKNTGKAFSTSDVHDRDRFHVSGLQVRVTDATGNVLPDQTKLHLPFHFRVISGFLNFTHVENGEYLELDFRLPAYATILEPGTYTVEATYNLGGKEPHFSPVAKASITYSVPDAAQAAARVRELIADGPKKHEWPFYTLKHPIFLQPLVDAARNGTTAATLGIAGIASVEANDALLELLKSEKPEVAPAAVEAIKMRLPSLTDPKRTAFNVRPAFGDRGPLLQHWHPRMDVTLMTEARRLLRQTNELQMAAGADLIVTRGGTEEAPLLLESLQRALEISRPPRSQTGDNHSGSIERLGYALEAMTELGWRVDFQSSNAAMTLVQFRQFSKRKLTPAADAEYIKRSFAWVENGPTYLKLKALDVLPMTGDIALKPLQAALSDSDGAVVRAACQAAKRSGHTELIPHLCKKMKSHQEPEVLKSASEAALALGARMAVWEAWTEALLDESTVVLALENLCVGTLTLLHPDRQGTAKYESTVDERLAIHKEWCAFLKKHRGVLQFGKRVSNFDFSVTPLLVGSGFGPSPREPAMTFRLRDGSVWPKR